MKEFYFVRHGQTDVNIGLLEGDHPHVPLNAEGRRQIERLRVNFPKIEFEIICRSPLLRVQETTEILFGKEHPAPCHIIDDLQECSWDVWQQMEKCHFSFEDHTFDELQLFLDQVKRGVDVLFGHRKSSLVVAHGGVFNALLHHLDIEWNWHAENGQLIRFVKDDRWQIQSLYVP